MVRRVLVVQPYGIGDLLFVTPVLRALRLLPSVERVDLLLGSRTETVVRTNPHVDEIFSVDKDIFHRRSSSQNLKELLQLGRRLRSVHYDLLLDYSLRGEYAFFGQFFLGISKRVGFDYKGRGFFHTHRLPLPEGFRGRHVVDFFCDLAALGGVPVQDRFLEFYLTEEDQADAASRLQEKNISGRFLVVAPGGGESWGKDAHFKRWPVPFFARMVERLREGDCGFEAVVILGSRGDRDLGDLLQAALKIPCVNLAGEIPFGTSAALIHRAVFFLGNDGGLMHLAHALRRPLMAFYGPVDPQVYGPYPPSSDAVTIVKEGLECRPCYQKFRYNSACIGRECLQALLPEEVLLPSHRHG